jgi:phosphoribosylformylglycinamidine cyclo-ligase
MPLTYVDAGVDQHKKDKVIDRILRMVRRTYDRGVMDLPWGFAGLYSLARSDAFRKPLQDPVLVACTDGVGTKLKLARALGKHDTVGIDLVAMSVNDLVVTGARPLFFLDYIAMGRVDKRVLLDVVKGIVAGCTASGCALLGGETAEMPGHYASGDYDLAGFCVGIVDRKDLIDGSRVKAGDEIVALPSSGLHSNGYSLARKIVENLRLSSRFGASTLGRTLLAPTRLYPKPVKAALAAHRIHAMANITGGGMVENIPRVIPKGLGVEIREGGWTVPPIFRFLQERGGVAHEEMYRVFNMGVGMVFVVPPGETKGLLRTLARAGERPRVIGRVVRGRSGVRIS